MWAASSKGFLIVSPLFLYMLLGPLWILIPNILKAINEFQSSRKLLMSVLVLVIPGIFGIITTESLRDALCIMAPMFFWSCHYFVVNRNLQISRIQILAICLLPNFLIWREGAVIEPWGILRRFFY